MDAHYGLAKLLGNFLRISREPWYVDEHARLWLAIGHCFCASYGQAMTLTCLRSQSQAKNGSPKPTMSNPGCRSVFFSRLNGLKVVEQELYIPEAP